METLAELPFIGDQVGLFRAQPGRQPTPRPASRPRGLAAYTRQGIYGPAIPPYEVYNPARAEVSTEHVFALAMNDVINNGMTPEAAIDKAFRRCEAIFAKYPIVQA